ncbi:MAG: NAD-dependent epimerase/dehydratase family protein [Flavobacteriaceae bacterium TMED238]|nr:MAG: NAD-dependent epimerase/dehydratase family protein [Flavobacteriaceae bacterium TMED238]|tara:strand:- start:100 stop:1020 length:921 start_codon:yes stop_codon:yes gene_type:complete
MKCIITGGSGFIGSHLVNYLIDDGHEVKIIDTRKPVQDIEWINKDIREDLSEEFKDIDFVFHLAAVANARKCGEDPSLANSVNILGTQNVLEISRRCGVKRVIIASSIWVAGSQVGDTVNENSYFDIPSVSTIYGVTKISNEMLSFAYKNEEGGPNYTVLRFGIPYGERMWRGLVVRAFMDMAENSGVINIMGDGKQSRPFLYVGDLCRAILLSMKPIAENKIYNLGGSRMISVEELAEQVVKHFPAKIDFIPQARTEPKIKDVSSWLAESELGWVPETDLKDGINRCSEWWKTLNRKEKDAEYWC